MTETATVVATAVESGGEQPEYISVSKFAKIFDMAPSVVNGAIASGNLKAIYLPTAGKGARKPRRIPMTEVERIKAGK